MSQQINVTSELVPHHYAGMVSAPSPGALSAQTQRVLIIGSYPEILGSSEIFKKAHLITSQDSANALFADQDSEMAQMLKASFDADTTSERYALAIKRTQEAPAQWSFRLQEEAELKDGYIVVGLKGHEPVRFEFLGGSFESLGPGLAHQIKQSGSMSASFEGQDLEIKIEKRAEDTCKNDLGIDVQVEGLKIECLSFDAGSLGLESLEQVLERLPEQQFTQIATCFNDPLSLAMLDDELEKRWGPERQTDGHAFAACKGSVDEILERYKKTRELKHITLIAASDSRTSCSQWAASLALVNAAHANKPYLPYSSLDLPMVVKSPETSYKLAERDLLLKNGISTHTTSGRRVKIERLVTMYSKDPAYRDLNKKQILSYLRFDFVNYLKQIYPRHALSNDDTQADGSVATPGSARDLAIARHLIWKRDKYVQDPGKTFKKEVRAQIDPNNPETLRFWLPVQLMGQMRRTITSIAFTA